MVNLERKTKARGLSSASENTLVNNLMIASVVNDANIKVAFLNKF